MNNFNCSPTQYYEYIKPPVRTAFHVAASSAVQHARKLRLNSSLVKGMQKNTIIASTMTKKPAIHAANTYK